MARQARCGTDGGYYRHLRKTHTPPCEPCKAAHAAANRSYPSYARQVAKPWTRKPKTPCVDCGKPSTADRCVSCAGRLRAARERDEDLAFHGSWVRVGHIWKPVERRTA